LDKMIAVLFNKKWWSKKLLLKSAEVL